MSRGFDALYHINFLGDVLAGTAELPAAETDEFVDELRENMTLAARSAQSTEQAGEWVLAASKARHLPALYTRAMTTEDSEAKAHAQALIGELSQIVRELTHTAVEAEDAAIDIISSGQGKALIDLIRDEVAQSLAMEENRLREYTNKSQSQMQVAEWSAIILPVVAMSIGMMILFLMQSGIIKSIKMFRNSAGAVVRGDLDVRVQDIRSDELGDLAQSFNHMAEVLQTVHKESEMLDGLQAMLVSSQTEAEAYTAATRVCQRLLPGLSGTFYATAASRNLSESVQGWGNTSYSADVFHPTDCRALRVGQIHCASVDSAEVICDHLDKNTLLASACIPLMSRDETLGCLSIFRYEAGAREIKSNELALAKTITNRLALALSNIRLAEKLRAQSIRDHLTGLYNRRYMEETLEREIVRASRQNKPLSVIALDADLFKRLNDEFSHEAGDQVLKALAEQMQNIVRESDIPCRVGGEEFLIVLPEVNKEIAVERAEDLRQRVQALNLTYQGRSLGKITISLGVASLSAQIVERQDLLRQADSALYQAKHLGRNQVFYIPEEA